MEFIKQGMGEYREGTDPAKRYIDDQQVAEAPIRTILGHFSLCGERLRIGYDGAEIALARAAERGWTVISMKNDWRALFPD